MIYKQVCFQKAVPLWEKGTQRQMNSALLFCVSLSKIEDAILRVTGHSNYQIFING